MTDRCKMAELYIDSELLILAVEKHPCLYNIEDDDYKDRNKKVVAWLAVGEKVLGDERWSQLSDDDRQRVGKEVQKRWRHLRDAFVKSMKSHDERPSNGPKWKKKYVFYKQMLFLLPILQNRRSANNTDETESDSALFKFSDAPHDEEEEGQRLIISQYTGSEIIPSNTSVESNPASAPIFKRKKKSNNKQFESKLLKILDKNTSKPTDSNNPDKLFLLSMLPTIATIPEENKLKFKIEILQVAQKYASMTECKELPTPPHSVSTLSSFNDSNQPVQLTASRETSPSLLQSDNTFSSVSSQSCSQPPSDEQSDDSIISLFS